MANIVTDLQNQAQGGLSFSKTVAASTNAYYGSAVDMLLTDGPVFGVLTSGTISASGLNVSCKLQEGDDTTTFTDLVAGGSWSITYNETTAASLFVPINGRRTKRYVRAAAAVTGTTITTVPLAISVFGMKKVLGGAGNQLT